MTKSEIENRISTIFESCDVEWDPRSRELKITDMYAKPDIVLPRGDFSVGGLIRQALQAQLVEEIGEVERPGCDTCDYGSEYGWIFRVTF